MRGVFVYLTLSFFFLLCLTATRAQDVVVPAGTLLHCTLDEPNFSSATADIGDPVLCHLNSLQSFGRTIFPRGSYLEGHLEADKEPGHFIGKGYMKLQFDRIGLSDTDLPVETKVIAARTYRIDRQGDIVGHGHAKRDMIEWSIPPLWPWKVLSLPARGPRPALKGEQPLTVRLMDDIVLPRTALVLAPGWHYFGQPSSLPSDTRALNPPPASPESNASSETHGARVTRIALKSRRTFEVTNYRIDGGHFNYVLSGGQVGAVDAQDVDWRTTSQLNARREKAAMPTRLASLRSN